MLKKLALAGAMALALGSGAGATGLTYNSAAQAARLAAALTAAVSGQSVDGAGNYGKLIIGTASLTTTGPITSSSTGFLCSVTLPRPSFSISANVATMLGTPLTSASCANAGTAALAEFVDANGTVIVSGLTVSTTGANINLATTTISVGLTVQVSSGTISTQ